MDDDNDIRTSAIFTQVNYSPMNGLKLVAGVRLEQQQKYQISIHQGLFSKPYPYKENTISYYHDLVEIIPRFAAIYNFDKNKV